MCAWLPKIISNSTILLIHLQHRSPEKNGPLSSTVHLRILPPHSSLLRLPMFLKLRTFCVHGKPSYSPYISNIHKQSKCQLCVLILENADCTMCMMRVTISQEVLSREMNVELRIWLQRDPTCYLLRMDNIFSHGT